MLELGLDSHDSRSMFFPLCCIICLGCTDYSMLKLHVELGKVSGDQGLSFV